MCLVRMGRNQSNFVVAVCRRTEPHIRQKHTLTTGSRFLGG